MGECLRRQDPRDPFYTHNREAGSRRKRRGFSHTRKGNGHLFGFLERTDIEEFLNLPHKTSRKIEAFFIGIFLSRIFPGANIYHLPICQNGAQTFNQFGIFLQPRLELLLGNLEKEKTHIWDHRCRTGFAGKQRYFAEERPLYQLPDPDIVTSLTGDMYVSGPGRYQWCSSPVEGNSTWT
jgi:hypothetical protein